MCIQDSRALLRMFGCTDPMFVFVQDPVAKALEYLRLSGLDPPPALVSSPSNFALDRSPAHASRRSLSEPTPQSGRLPASSATANPEEAARASDTFLQYGDVQYGDVGGRIAELQRQNLQAQQAALDSNAQQQVSADVCAC